MTRFVEVPASDVNTLREILEYVRLELADGHGIDLTHDESVVLMQKFDALANAAKVIADAQSPSIADLLRARGYEWEANAVEKIEEVAL